MIKINRIIIILMTAGCLHQKLAAEDSGDLFMQANEAYIQGDFNRAIELYKDIVRSETVHLPEVYYNIGNAYFRIGQPGRALLWWERTLILVPRDKDARFNRTFARTRLLKDYQSRKAADIILRLLKNSINLNEAKTLCAVIYIVGMLCFAGWLFLRNKLYVKTSLMCLCLVIISGVYLRVIYVYQVSSRRAVIVVPTAEVYNGPDESFNVGFTIPEGTEAVLLREKSAWQEIGIKRRGLKGWIKKEMVEQI